MKRMFRVLPVILFFAFSTHAAEDWSSCSSDLDRMRRAARDIKDLAEQLSSLASELDSLADRANYCRRGDASSHCDGISHDLRSRQSDFRLQLLQLSSELNTLVTRFKHVKSACGIPSSGNSLCDVYRSYKGRLPSADLQRLCKENMTEEQCKQCLETP